MAMLYILHCLALYFLQCNGQTVPVDATITLPINSSSASSTCGLNNSAEEICERGGVCGVCVESAHTIDMAHDSQYNTYWQSSTYPHIQDGVNITLTLGGLFLIDEISLTFYSARPNVFTLYTSTDHGLSYLPIQYFSLSCADVTPSDECMSSGTGLLPLTGGLATFRASSSMLATNIMITLEELATLGDELTCDPQVLRGYWYAISEIVVLGRCHCNGHGTSCAAELDGLYNCNCDNNTAGRNCEMCLPGFNDRQWTVAQECKRCDCNGHSEECHFDDAQFAASGNTSGGVCDSCRDNTDGSNCHLCIEGYYHDEQYNCTACVCDPRGTEGSDGNCSTAAAIYATNSNACPCKALVEGTTCNTCNPGYYNLSAAHNNGCEDCLCNGEGSFNANCHPLTGQCSCRAGYYGRTCSPCACDSQGAIDSSCDSEGVCQCREGAAIPKCDNCQQGFYKMDAGCIPCACYPNGSNSSYCNSTTGLCDCIEGFSGRNCSICPPGRHNIQENCPECPTCYQNITIEYNKVLSDLQLLNTTITQSRNNYSISDSLSYRLGNITNQINQLSNVIMDLILEEYYFSLALNQTRNESLQLKTNVFDRFAHLVQDSERTLIITMEQSNKTHQLLIDINLTASLIRDILEENVRMNITSAMNAQNQLLSQSQDLQVLLQQLDEMIMQKEQSIANIMISADNLTNSSNNSFVTMCDTIEQQNITLVQLTVAQNLANSVDILFEDAKEKLIRATNNIKMISNFSNSITNISLNSSNIEELYNRLQYLQDSIDEVFQLTSEILDDVQLIQHNYSTVSNESQNIISKLALLKNASDQLVQQIRNFGVSINQFIDLSTAEIQSINQTSIELNNYLQNATAYINELTSVLTSITTAEMTSIKVTDDAIEQENVLETLGHNISSAINFLEATSNAVNLIITVIHQIETVSNESNDNAVYLEANATALSETLTDINDTLLVSIDNATVVKAMAIETINDTVTTTRDKISELENRTLIIVNMLSQLQSRIESISALIPQAEYDNIATSLTELEAMSDALDVALAIARSDLEEFDAVSHELEEKYTEVQQHRDLIQDIQYSLEKLDCQMEYRLV